MESKKGKIYTDICIAHVFGYAHMEKQWNEPQKT